MANFLVVTLLKNSVKLLNKWRNKNLILTMMLPIIKFKGLKMYRYKLQSDKCVGNIITELFQVAILVYISNL